MNFKKPFKKINQKKSICAPVLELQLFDDNFQIKIIG